MSGFLRFAKRAVYQTRFLSGQQQFTNSIVELFDRGVYADIFPDTAKSEIGELCNQNKQCVYSGFDPTADGLHVGNLLILINLLNWYRRGHDVIVLIGDATASIGDPSDRLTEREIMLQTQLNENTFGIESDIKTITNNYNKYFGGACGRENSLEILKNGDWYKKWSVIEFVREIGRYFRMGKMLSRTSVQTRLNSPQAFSNQKKGMSFTEFSYSLFQAYDWLYLLNRYNCRFQIGGSDQMGNMKAGFDLIGRKDKRSVYGLTMPLIKSESGDKFGKSAGNVIWLRAAKTSNFDFYQFWMRIADDQIESLLRMFTFETIDAIEKVMREHRLKPEMRLAQKKLAETVTLLVHGEKGLEEAQETSKVIYSKDIELVAELPMERVMKVFAGAPVVELNVEHGLKIVDLVMRAKCFATKQDAIRIIKAGGFSINYMKMNDSDAVLDPVVHILKNRISLLRVGKKNYSIVQWNV